MVQTRIEVFPDIPELVDFFEEVPEYDSAMYRHKKMKTTEETSLNLLKEVLPLLEAQDDYSNDALFEALVAFGKEHGYKTGYIMWPIRTALSGKQTTPAGATEILEILGKEESIKRIHAAIENLEKLSMSLSETQSRAGAHGAGPCICLAGPGSGKTTVITERTKYLIEKQGISPSEILVITFTKAASIEMRERFHNAMKGR